MLGDRDGERVVWIGDANQSVLVRESDQDVEGKWAWRIDRACGDECHHPVHAFGERTPLRHLEWFAPGAAELAPACTCPSPETDWSPDEPCGGVFVTPYNADGTPGETRDPGCCEVHMKPWGHRRGCPIHNPKPEP